MSRNHRVIRKTDELCEYWYAVYEVFYDHNGEINGWTKEPVSFGGSDISYIEYTLKHMIKCLNKPVLEEVDGKLEEVE
jgi:hypothetical protein